MIFISLLKERIDNMKKVIKKANFFELSFITILGFENLLWANTLSQISNQAILYRWFSIGIITTFAILLAYKIFLDKNKRFAFLALGLIILITIIVYNIIPNPYTLFITSIVLVFIFFGYTVKKFIDYLKLSSKE